MHYLVCFGLTMKCTYMHNMNTNMNVSMLMFSSPQ